MSEPRSAVQIANVHWATNVHFTKPLLCWGKKQRDTVIEFSLITLSAKQDVLLGKFIHVFCDCARHEYSNISHTQIYNRNNKYRNANLIYIKYCVSIITHMFSKLVKYTRKICKVYLSTKDRLWYSKSNYLQSSTLRNSGQNRDFATLILSMPYSTCQFVLTPTFRIVMNSHS